MKKTSDIKTLGEKGTAKKAFQDPTCKRALIIFTRNPELGKCKTRLAATIGDTAALEIYKLLLQHTVNITTPVVADKFVYYSNAVQEKDRWNSAIYHKKKQNGLDLGIRMQHAFEEIFNLGYEHAIIIGSDMYDLNTENLEEAFSALENHNYVLGPAEDGGYYLLGMTKLNKALFQQKAWGTNTVLSDTKKDLIHETVKFLEAKNDIDVYEDVKDILAFKAFI